MGNGQSPPGIDLGTRGTIDDGNLARAESPPPGPVGFDAKGGTAKGSGAEPRGPDHQLRAPAARRARWGRRVLHAGRSGAPKCGREKRQGLWDQSLQTPTTSGARRWP